MDRACSPLAILVGRREARRRCHTVRYGAGGPSGWRFAGQGHARPQATALRCAERRQAVTAGGGSRRLLAEFEVWQRQFGSALGQVDVITARRFSAVWQRPESGHLSGCGPMADQTKVCRIAVEGQILPVSPVSSSRNWASTFVYIVSCAGNRRPSGRYLQIRFFGATVHAGAARITCSLNLTKSG